jgi:hypothetical protein
VFTVTLVRGQLLTTGPLAILAVCYAVAAPSSSTNRIEPFLSPVTMGRAFRPLDEDCRSTADGLRESLPADWHIVVRKPFVIAGDFSEEHLDRYQRDTIAPTVRALSLQFFDAPPAWPITVVICSSDESYRECNRCLGGRDRSEYAGIYSRSEHRVVVNIATGDGTLAHELTHALAHIDFPELPEWLDEGLASLYEECEFSPDGQRLIGLENWRGAVLAGLLRRGELPAISELAGDQFANGDASVDYAQARYFCLYLQKHNLLEAFYRKCRSRQKLDRDGMQSLADALGTADERAIDRQFHAWLKSLKSVGR